MDRCKTCFGGTYNSYNLTFFTVLAELFPVENPRYMRPEKQQSKIVMTAQSFSTSSDR